jgi:hypothetical protein
VQIASFEDVASCGRPALDRLRLRTIDQLGTLLTTNRLPTIE